MAAVLACKFSTLLSSHSSLLTARAALSDSLTNDFFCSTREHDYNNIINNK